METNTVSNHAISLLDENGQETMFEHILTFKYEGEKYLALFAIENGRVNDEELIFLKIDSSSGEDRYLPIENEILLEEVFNEFMALLDEMDD